MKPRIYAARPAALQRFIARTASASASDSRAFLPGKSPLPASQIHAFLANFAHQRRALMIRGRGVGFGVEKRAGFVEKREP